jgi:hypothetical protein
MNSNFLVRRRLVPRLDHIEVGKAKQLLGDQGTEHDTERQCLVAPDTAEITA